MTNVELIEVISFVLEDLMAGHPTVAPGHFPTRDKPDAAAG
ncbi:hypothetical protein [Bradyrhizobium sp. 157]|nr:hypothetical protein [Bradyrhizobium sp. 157]